MAAVLPFFKQRTIGLIVADPAVAAVGAEYLVIVSSFYVVLTSMFVTGGVNCTTGHTLTAMIFTLVGLWTVRISVSAFLASRLGRSGIWRGIPAGVGRQI